MGTRYVWFIVPAVVVTVAIIIFPWMFTVYMSLHDWQITGARTFIGLDNYVSAFSDRRFIAAVWRTALYALFSVTMPVVLGTAAATVFHHEFPLRGLVRGICIMPMMATSVAVALVWARMFHPQLGVLNYLLKSVGLTPSLWVYAPGTVLPALAMVETWQWTPLVMLIVLGGLATLPVEPYESARIDGAAPWQTFIYITLPLVMPVILVAVVLRTIDALKAFDLIFTITQGGPGTASETLNIFLYLKAFSFYQIGQASAVVVIFFALIVGLSLGSLYLRERTRWV